MFSDLHRLYMLIKQTRQKEAGYLERIWQFFFEFDRQWDYRE